MFLIPFCSVSRGILGGSLDDLVRDLGPHMLSTPMFQRFRMFPVECVLGGSGNALGGAQIQKVMYISRLTVFSERLYLVRCGF